MASTISIAEFKRDLNNRFDSVSKSKRKLIVRKNDERVVIISLSEFNSIKETAYLLSTENNRKHLSKSLAQAKRKQVVKVDLSDL